MHLQDILHPEETSSVIPRGSSAIDALYYITTIDTAAAQDNRAW